MLEPFAVTLAALLLMLVLLGAGAALKRQQIDVAGVPPIDHRLFHASKLAVTAVWAAMVAQSWGAPLAFVNVPRVSSRAGLLLWIAGVVVMCLGRFDLGSSLRMGTPKERTSLRVNGLYRFSRNPMYLGMYVTLVAACLYTLNPLVFGVGLFAAAVHHRIVLAEERFLSNAFPAEYPEYCRRVRRYL